MFQLILCLIIFCALLVIVTTIKRDRNTYFGKDMYRIDKRFDLRIFNEIYDSLDQENQDKITTIKELLESASDTLSGIETDNLYCAPLGDVKENKGEILLQEVGAFSHGTKSELGRNVFSDVKLTEEVPLYINTKYVDHLKRLRASILKLLSELSTNILIPNIQKDVKRYDARSFIRKLTKQNVSMDKQLIQMQFDVVVACEDQRERLKKINPDLARYELRDKVVHDPYTIPEYEYGKSLFITSKTVDQPFPSVNSISDKTTLNPIGVQDFDEQPAQSAFNLL